MASGLILILVDVVAANAPVERRTSHGADVLDPGSGRGRVPRAVTGSIGVRDDGGA
jgi:hypothetical protein